MREHSACLRIDGQQRGSSIDARALVEHSIEVKKPFRVAVDGVRVLCDHFVAVSWSGATLWK